MTKSTKKKVVKKKVVLPSVKAEKAALASLRAERLIETELSMKPLSALSARRVCARRIIETLKKNDLLKI